MNDTKICAGIVTFNSQDHLEACLKSLAAQTRPVDQIRIFDNSSANFPIHQVQELVAKVPGLPETLIHMSPVNLGFGQAHNRIIREWDGSHYLMLNPDVVLAPDFVQEALKAFSQNPKLGAINGQVRYQDGRMPSPYIYSMGHVLFKDRRFEDLGIGQHSETIEHHSRIIFGPNGACPVLLMHALRDVSYQEGPFDKAYFLYGEDDDLNWRMALAGWQSLYAPHCLAWHDAGASGGFKSARARRNALANRWLTLVKNDRLINFVCDFPIIASLEVLYWAARTLKRPAFIVDIFGATLLFLRHLPHALSRRRIQPIRISSKEERSLFEPGMIQRLQTVLRRTLGKDHHRSLWTKAERG